MRASVAPYLPERARCSGLADLYAGAGRAREHEVERAIAAAQFSALQMPIG